MADTTDPQFPPRDRLFALIASIPGSGAFDWCTPARALLDEIEASAPSAPADRAGLLDAAAQAIRDSNGSPEALEWWRTHPQLIPAHVYAAAVLSVLPSAADRAASYRLAADAIESMQGYPHLILPEEIVAGLRLLATGAQPEPGSPAYTRRLAAGERDEQQTQQGDGAAPEEALDLSDGPVRCPLCPYPVTLHTPNGARAHFTTVHPEQRITGRGSGPWPLLTTDGDEEQQAETQAHQPSRAWKVESPRRDKWASWGATYDEREWAQQMYDSVIETAAQRPFRLVRAETTYTVEAEHVPAARPAVVAEPGKEA